MLVSVGSRGVVGVGWADRGGMDYRTTRVSRIVRG